MMPSSSRFRTRFETVLRLASTALAISRNVFRASAFRSRRILTSRSSRLGEVIVFISRGIPTLEMSAARAGRFEQCLVHYQYFGHLYDLVELEFIYVQNCAEASDGLVEFVQAGRILRLRRVQRRNRRRLPGVPC